MKILKIRKKFDYKGLELQIVEREEPYMNAKEPMVMTRVLAPNGGMIPIRDYGKTLKSMQEATVRLLEDFEKRGADVKKELTKKIQL